MGQLGEFLDQLSGQLHFYVTIGEHPAAEVIVQGKHIIIEIKSILLSTEAVVKYLMGKGKGSGSSDDFLRSMKKKGYRLTIKYKFFEFDL
ncbi:MAG: hypothetical protein KKA90_01715 [Nanoarchaeota archaeon]|nr:hypothetical protein [Nanoarchaeota archaeon]